MTGQENSDLPVLVEDFLPVPLPDLGPKPNEVKSHYVGWHTWASQQIVRDMIWDSFSNSLLIATSGGILKWAGDYGSFTRYYSEHGLPGNGVSKLAIDGLGQIWCAPDLGGLYYLATDRWLPHPESELLSNRFRSSTTDSHGRLWAGSKDGLWCVSLTGGVDKFISVPAPEAPRSITVSDEGTIWFCSSQGLFAVDPDGMHVKQAGTQSSLLTLTCTGSELWVGKMDGLVHMDLSTGNISQVDACPRSPVTALVASPEGLFVGCENQIGRIQQEQWQLIGKDSCQVRSLAIDEDGALLWSGCRGIRKTRLDEGESILATRKFPDHIPTLDWVGEGMFLDNLVQCLAVESRTPSPVLWVATPQGLFRHDPTAIHFGAWTFHVPEGVGDVQALSVGPEPKSLLLGGWAGGVTYRPAEGNTARTPGLTGPVLNLISGLADVTWAISLDGLFYSQGSDWSLVLSSSQLPAGMELRSAVQLAPDHLLLGGSNGLIDFDLNSRLTTEAAIADGPPSVTALIYDGDSQMLWIGGEQGLRGFRRHGDEWQMRHDFTIFNSGLASPFITSLALSRREDLMQLWIGTGRGLNQYEYEIG